MVIVMIEQIKLPTPLHSLFRLFFWSADTAM